MKAIIHISGKLAATLIIMLIAMNAKGQGDASLSHYMFTKTLYNPAAVGSEERICLDAAYNQWMESLEGAAPTVSNFNFHSPFKLFGKTHGVGLSFANNTEGFSNDIVARLNYAYRFSVGAGKMGIGVYGGIINNSFSPDFKSPYGPFNDNLVPLAKADGLTPDFGIGLYYNAQNTYLSVSMTHLTEPGLNFKSENTGTALHLNRTLYVSSGYELGLSNPLFAFRPSVFFKSDFIITEVAVSGILSYNDRVWGGVSYRNGNSVAALFGVELYDGIQFGVSYDYKFGAIQSISGSTMEVLVKYCFSLKKEKIPQKYKSVRFL